jgi:hypothetical protein
MLIPFETGPMAQDCRQETHIAQFAHREGIRRSQAGLRTRETPLEAGETSSHTPLAQ